MSKDSLAKGTIILTLSAFIARFLGLVQRIPLQNLLGDTGMGTYSISYNIYFLFFTIATAGFPSAVSKLVSERMELGRKAEAERIFAAATWFALVSGLVMTIVLYLYAPIQAAASKDLSAIGPIRTIAPSLLLFPLAAIIRGYFQGRQRMMPNGLSQIVEQILRVASAIFLAYLFIHVLDKGLVWGVIGASFGGVMGTIGAVAVLLVYLRNMRKQDRLDGLIPSVTEQRAAARLSYKQIYRTLLNVSVPIVLYSATVPAINYIDTTIVKPLLIGQLGDHAAQQVLGQLATRAQSLAGLPIVLAIAISQSIVPIVSAAYAKRDYGLVSRQAAKALQLALLTGLPFVILIATGARSFNALAFGDAAGTGLVVFMTLTAIFQILMQTSGAILTGMGMMKPLVGHFVIGVLVKLIFSYALAPFLGVYGIMTGSALCFLAIAWLNDRSFKKKIPNFEVFTRKRWVRFVFSCIVSALCGSLMQWLSGLVVGGLKYRMDVLIQATLVGITVCITYALMLGFTRVVTRQELKTYPSMVQKLIRRVGRLFGFQL